VYAGQCGDLRPAPADLNRVRNVDHEPASSEHAYEQLRALTLSDEFVPGAAFSEVQLVEQLGISRTLLHRLEAKRLLRSEHNRRVRVSLLSTSDFEHLYAMRDHV
jgi:DNA-binding GntR family transcriptional regulator